ncbi:hypothetical protein KDL45_12825, partial [bacterium]|nr:hypothetical protein [bacterium]
DLQLKGAQFYLDLDKKPEEAGPEMQIAVKSIGLSARTDMSTGDTSAELRVADGDFKMGEMHDTVERIDIDATANLIDWVATVTKAEARAPGLSLDLTASATDLVGDIVVLADLDGKVQISKVNDLITPEPTLGGEVSIQAHAELPLPEYKVDAKVTMPSGRVNQMHVGDLRIAANLDSEKVAVTDLFLRAGGGTLSAKADLGLKNDMPLAADVKIDKIDVRRALEEYGLREAGVGTFVTGTVHADGRLGNKESGTPMRIASAVDLEASNFHFQDVVKIPSITLDAKSVYQPTGVDVENLQVQTAKTTIKVDGRVKLPEVGLGLNVFVDSPDLTEFSPIGGKEVGGAIHIEAKSGGTAKEPSTDAAIQAEDLHYADFGVDEIKGVVAMAGKKIDVSSLTIRAQETVINADAKVNLAQSPPRIDARLKTDKADIADLTAAAGQKELALAGVVDLNVDVEGPADRLTGTAFVHGEKIKAFGENVETLHLDTKLADGQVNVDELKIVKLAPPRPDYTQRADKVLNTPKSEWKTVTIQGKGSVDPNSGKIDFVLNAENLNEQTSDNLRERNIPLLADVDLNLDAGGSISDPQAKLTLAIRQARYGEMVLGNSQLEVNVADQKAHVTGTLLADRQKVAKDVPVPVTERDWVIRRFDSKAEPAPQTPNDGAEASSSPKDFTVDPLAVGDGTGDADPFAKALQNNAALLAEQPLGRVAVDITASLTDDQALSGEVAFEQFDFSDFLAPLKNDQPVVTKNHDGESEVVEGQDLVEGYLDGRIAIDGSLKDAANAELAVDFNKLYVRKNEVWLRNESPTGEDQPLRLTYQGGRLSVESFYLGGTGLTAKLEEQGDQVVFLLEAGLVVAQEFVPMLADADGKVIVEASIPRQIDPAAARAQVRLEGGELGFQGVPTPVEDLNLIVSYTNGKLEVDRLDANIGGGTLDGGGEVTPAKDDKDYTHLDLYVRLRDVDTGMDPYLAMSVDKV